MNKQRLMAEDTDQMEDRHSQRPEKKNGPGREKKTHLTPTAVQYRALKRHHPSVGSKHGETCWCSARVLQGCSNGLGAVLHSPLQGLCRTYQTEKSPHGTLQFPPISLVSRALLYPFVTPLSSSISLHFQFLHSLDLGATMQQTCRIRTCHHYWPTH